jgi:hypothetical protein
MRPRFRTCKPVMVAVVLTLQAGAPAAAADDKRQLAVVSGSTPMQLRILEPDGAPVRTLVSRPSSIGYPSWSRDEKTIAYAESGQILLQSATGGVEKPLTAGGSPSFSPAKDEIAYWSWTSPNRTLNVIGADGQNDRVVAGPFTSMSLGYVASPAWSPDGKTLAFALGGSIVSVPAGGGESPTTIASPGPGESLGRPAYAPDGNRIAYVRELPVPPACTQGPPDQLVVRELESGAERVVVDHQNCYVQMGNLASPSWSADSERIAYIEDDFTNIPYRFRLVTAGDDGSGRAVLIDSTDFVNFVSWANAPRSPNYYVKHVEVAQAISPTLGALGAVDPLKPDPYESAWQIPVVSGWPIPLIAGRGMLLRIYVGDAALEVGTLETRSVHYRVQVGPTVVEGDANVDVTAGDRQPDQLSQAAAVNVWVPGAATASGATLTAEVEVNADERQAECPGCYPNGNRAKVGGIAFEQGGSLSLAQVPIVIAGRGGIRHPDPRYATVGSSVAKYLPVGDGGVGVVRFPVPLVVSQDVLTLMGPRACKYLLTVVSLARLMSPAQPGQLWVGTASPRAPLDCSGLAWLGGSSILVNEPKAELLAHEVGHALGLAHTLSLEGRPPDAAPLPYAGIGGVGYDGQLHPLMLDPLHTSDLMGYSSHRTWTSPATWWRMHQAIVGHVTRARSAGATAASRLGAADARRPRRLVSGYLDGRRGRIFSSLVASATAPEAEGPTAARLVALDRRGRVIAKARVRGTPLDEGSGRELPFVIALPPTAKGAALQLRSRSGSKLATLRRSRNAPTGRFVRLPHRTRARKPLTVRWRASDRDRRDRLSVVVLARRGGRPWQTITIGPARASTTVRPHVLGAGRKLRLRLLVSDGFRTSKIDSRPIRISAGP